MRYPRTIIFVDLSGFTSFIQRTDDEQAKAMLKDFREVSRDLASEVGVRIDKFLGDGFMAIAVDQNAGVIFSLELQRRFAERLGGRIAKQDRCVRCFGKAGFVAE